ncbi:hypothetical protein ACLOJK_037452 [Asimina triloba]
MEIFKQHGFKPARKLAFLPDDVPLTRSTYSLIVNPSPSPNLFYFVAIIQPIKHLKDKLPSSTSLPRPNSGKYIESLARGAIRLPKRRQLQLPTAKNQEQRTLKRAAASNERLQREYSFGGIYIEGQSPISYPSSSSRVASNSPNPLPYLFQREPSLPVTNGEDDQ